MQKLTGISSCKNNKSCSIIHSGFNKIGFTFFCDFLRNLQEAAKTVLLFELPIAGRPSKRTSVSQCGPWADRPARLAGIETLRWGIRPGDGWGRKRRSLGFGLWPQTGGGALVGSRLAASRPRCGSAPVVLRSGRGAVGAGRLGRPCGAVGLQRDRRHELEKGKNSPCGARKVVDLTTLYNFCKGRLVFFSTDFAGTSCQHWMPACSGKQEVLSVDRVFHQFPLKIWNANLHESCVPQ
jgi:hypothetical protein